jgi:glutathione S-transferase
VQRAVIALTEKGVPFERIDVDLADKPDWFKAISPLGKTPVLLVHAPQKWEPVLRPRAGTNNGETAIFESAVILEYLEETQARPLHPADALARAEHRAFIEFGSAILNDIWGLYTAGDEAAFAAKAAALRGKFERIEARLARFQTKWEQVRRPESAPAQQPPWFDGEAFSLVDAVFGPVFRYFDAFDRIGDFGILCDLPKVAAWRAALAARPSVRAAVSPEYPALLWRFYRTRGSHVSRLIERREAVSDAA